MALLKEDYQACADLIGCDIAAVMAVAEVEARGGGFNPDNSPKSLFEGHYFHKLTKGVYDASHPTLSYPKWTREFYGKSWQAEQTRLQQAMTLDRPAALKSASFGMFQIMGANHALCGFPGPESFYDAMCKSESEHLKAFTNFIINSKLADEMINKDFVKLAIAYNGPQQAQNHYSDKLATAYAKYSAQQGSNLC